MIRGAPQRYGPARKTTRRFRAPSALLRPDVGTRVIWLRALFAEKTAVITTYPQGRARPGGLSTGRLRRRPAQVGGGSGRCGSGPCGLRPVRAQAGAGSGRWRAQAGAGSGRCGLRSSPGPDSSAQVSAAPGGNAGGPAAPLGRKPGDQGRGDAGDGQHDRDVADERQRVQLAGRPLPLMRERAGQRSHSAVASRLARTQV